MQKWKGMAYKGALIFFAKDAARARSCNLGIWPFLIS